ncbi:MAG TPA: hypothetical protein VMQ52_02470 [Candidatus Saccharimonadales bacterium]|jgi:hypothetical protein|nr:hypothetical protein [Candidatus Saccharimonadales bacterium]
MVEEKQKPTDETTSMDINQAAGYRSRLRSKRTIVIIFVIVLVCIGGAIYWGLYKNPTPISGTVFESNIQNDGLNSNPKAAQQTLSQFLASKPSVANKQFAITQVGGVYLESSQYAQAINEYLQAQALSPKQNILYLDEALAEAYQKTDQNAQAIIYYNKAIAALNPKDLMTPGDKIGFEQTIQELSK